MFRACLVGIFWVLAFLPGLGSAGYFQGLENSGLRGNTAGISREGPVIVIVVDALRPDRRTISR